jgi:hypothetical protein
MLVSNKAEIGLQPQDVNQDLLRCMVVKLSLSHYGNKRDGGCVRAGWGMCESRMLRRLFGPKRRVRGVEKICTAISIVSCTFHHILTE